MEQIRFYVGYRRTITFVPVNINGEPVPVDGPIRADVYSGEDPETGEPYPNVVQLADQGGGVFQLTGASAGSGTFTVYCDALLGDGVTNLMKQYEVVVEEIASSYAVTIGPLVQ